MTDVLVRTLDPRQLAGRERQLEPMVASAYTRGKGELHLPQLAEGLLMAACCGITSTAQLTLGAWGKPSFSRAAPERFQAMSFNLSTSPVAAALALAPQAVGVDVQQVMPPDWAVAKRFLGKEAADRLQSLPPFIQPGAFTLEWTRLEAVLKADGRGFAAPRSEFPQLLDAWQTESMLLGGYALSVATADAPSVEVVALSLDEVLDLIAHSGQADPR